MKQFVNLIQLVVVMALAYPMFHIWDTDKVEQLCKVIEPGMSKTAFMQLADDSNVKMIGPLDDTSYGGKWQALVTTRTPFSDSSCVIKGAGNTVAVSLSIS